MAALHGTVGEYDSKLEQWTSYTERLEFYFAANDVSSPEKQRAILLSAWAIHIPADSQLSSTSQAFQQDVRGAGSIGQDPLQPETVGYHEPLQVYRVRPQPG